MKKNFDLNKNGFDRFTVYSVDFCEECQEKISCEFTNFLSNNRAKLFELSFDGTMARLDVNYAENNGIKNEIEFRNCFSKKF